MTEELQSILLEDLDIAWPGVRVRRLALNRHMPRVEKLSTHSHSFSQILLYLRGHGTQQLGAREIAVQRGSLLWIEGGEEHGFTKDRHVRPVCLAIELDFQEAQPWNVSSQLNHRDLSHIETMLFKLSECQKDSGGLSLRAASLLLQILDRLGSSLELGSDTEEPKPLASRIEKLILKNDFSRATPSGISAEFGKSLDHLNRLLREENSPSLGRIIHGVQLRKCQALLRRTDRSIGEIGSEIGIDDQNYFARWFRRHTGQSPTRWREASRASEEQGTH